MPPRLIVVLAFEGFEILDLTGPAAVFDSANQLLKQEAYRIWTVSPGGGTLASSSGVTVETQPLEHLPREAVDTFLVVGAPEPDVRKAIADPAIRIWLPQWVARASRFGSICSGALILAALRLLDGKRATTHWDACDLLANNFRDVDVETEALYVVDGPIWTSAGVTTGIDMSLAMVERDHGAPLAANIAKRLVLYARRPGHQAQVSTLLSAQTRADNPFAEVIDWVQAHLAGKLDGPMLAERAGLTERSFYRKFIAATGQTPAAFVESLRVEAARTLLTRDLSLKVVAAAVGLDQRRLNNAFERRTGMSAQAFRDMHSESEAAVQTDAGRLAGAAM